jgi:hypothetical protein
MPVLNVMTPLTEPVNIIRMYRSLWHAYSDVRLRWLVVANEDSDPDVLGRLIQTNDLIDVVVAHHKEAGNGNPQRNYALENLTSEGYCTWLADDTILHPLFMQSLRRFIMFGWKGVLVGQGREDGYITPDKNHLDPGQIVVHTNVIGEAKWRKGAPEFVSDLQPFNFAFVDEELSYQSWTSRGTGARG